MSDRHPTTADTARQRRLELHLQADNLPGFRRLVAEEGTHWPYADWVLSRFGVPVTEESLARLPPGMRSPLEGWNAYREGRAARAEDLLLQSLAVETVDLAWIALGLAKVYTHIAHWRLARDWCLVALAQARAEDDLAQVSHGYGALGEILLRAGRPMAAFEAFELSFRLAQAGAGAVERRLNCLAGALSRCGENVVVETLLMSALHLAAGRDPVSLRYSLARLQFHYLTVGRDTLVAEELPEFAGEHCPAFEPDAYLAMGQAFAEARLGRTEAAIASAGLAERRFLPAMPLEAFWARRLRGLLEGERVEGLADDWHGCEGRTAQAPDSPFDRLWREHELEDEGPALIARADTVEDLFEVRRMFFV